MLKFTKALFFVLGVAAAVVAAVFLIQLFQQPDLTVGAAQPTLQIWIVAAAAVLTGLFLGIALALPRRSARSIRNEMTRNLVAVDQAQPTTTTTVRDTGEE